MLKLIQKNLVYLNLFCWSYIFECNDMSLWFGTRWMDVGTDDDHGERMVSKQNVSLPNWYAAPRQWAITRIRADAWWCKRSNLNRWSPCGIQLCLYWIISVIKLNPYWDLIKSNRPQAADVWRKFVRWFIFTTWLHSITQFQVQKIHLSLVDARHVSH